jgi:hypothetical protein
VTGFNLLETALLAGFFASSDQVLHFIKYWKILNQEVTQNEKFGLVSNDMYLINFCLNRLRIEMKVKKI